MTVLIVVGGVLAAALVWGAVLYNGLVHLRNDIDRAWANIDVLLLQRADEVPNLVEVCKGYATHERETLEAVIRARSAVRDADGVAAKSRAANGLNDALGQVYGLVERYPTLRADKAFLRLQRRITGIEDEVADRREVFNASVMRYNTRIEQFPETLLARALGLERRALFTAEPHALRRPSVS